MTDAGLNDVLVVGAGAWGTALAIQAARAGRRVRLWARSEETAIRLQKTRHNPRLPGIVIHDAVTVTHQLDQAAFALLAVPMQHMRAVAQNLPPMRLITCCKGVESKTGLFPLEILATLFPALHHAVLSGPNFAHEVAAGLPAASVIASTDAGLRSDLIHALGSAGFRLYGNADPVGAQVGGAAKNVIAIAAGATIGAGLGENARAALVTRGIAELSRLAVMLGGQAATVAGLSGLGDLLLTCTGKASRNFRLGFALGQGMALDQALATSEGVVEGVMTAPALLQRAGPDADLPVISAVAAMVSGQADFQEAMSALLSRPVRDE
ncbi:NAD(P)H-dependent glycerol-3-phosphate dehydrogenase [Granulibacter bethesdensis]|uniref:NAD(P)H-dependent glycerol-3-phosphate dehydrogenase n=1 Tax=Granulibacter bethesdensis TaxID=364410 RepID=UPI0003F2024B|nr:NAD(P)H-dependent glycerol-3-phosphate dehydrogenase [Granulibacter bethesdensis]AHJ69638.1 Glycerol-3-phosphate dehydrogenase [NAD(P)+] [Granulibacter bethesdensis]